jgi:hypothetical protein
LEGGEAGEGRRGRAGEGERKEVEEEEERFETSVNTICNKEEVRGSEGDNVKAYSFRFDSIRVSVARYMRENEREREGKGTNFVITSDRFLIPP